MGAHTGGVMPRETRVTIRFDSMEDAADFVREAKARGMLPARAGLRRMDAAQDCTGRGVVLDQLVVTASTAAYAWIVAPRGEGLVL